MSSDSRRHLSERLLEEFSVRIRLDDELRSRLESLADLPPERVAAALLEQFRSFLSTDLCELIDHLVRTEIDTEREALESPAPVEIPRAAPEPETLSADRGDRLDYVDLPETRDDHLVSLSEDIDLLTSPSESIMEHFGQREPFPYEPVDFSIEPTDWLYIYGFSYAPDSTGKGIPSKKLAFKGVDGVNQVFVIDYGDVRFYANRLNEGEYGMDKAGKPIVTPKMTTEWKYEHERILNLLRSEDVLVSTPFLSLKQGLEALIRTVEDRYVELLRALIDAHDLVEWDIDVMAFDDHLLQLPSITAEAKAHRPPQRETRHTLSKVRDIKLTEKVIFKEKSVAQEIHNELLLHAIRSKVDYMVRLDSAIMGDWKSILSARYVVGKDKRRAFCQAVSRLQDEYGELRLMFRMTNPLGRFALAS